MNGIYYRIFNSDFLGQKESEKIAGFIFEFLFWGGMFWEQ
jgi:hypothetical protein